MRHCPLPAFRFATNNASERVVRHARAVDQRSLVRSVAESSRAESSQRSKTLPVGSESFFSFSLELQQSASKMAGGGRYARAFVLDRRQKFGESAARSDGVVELTMAQKWGTTDKQNPNKSAVDPLGSGCWCINTSVTCDPRQNKFLSNHQRLLQHKHNFTTAPSCKQQSSPWLLGESWLKGKLSEIEKRLSMGLLKVINTTSENLQLADCKAQVSSVSGTNALLICASRSDLISNFSVPSCKKVKNNPQVNSRCGDQKIVRIVRNCARGCAQGDKHCQRNLQGA